jgi:hypothetical protein
MDARSAMAQQHRHGGRAAWSILAGRALLLSSAMLTACATAPWHAGSVWIETVSGGATVTGASCTVSNEGIARTITTPDTIVVPYRGDLRIVCERSGYQRTELVQRGAFPNAPSNSTLGIGIGGGSGNVGLGIGLNLPLGSGGGGSYPAKITVDMPLVQDRPQDKAR